MQKYREVSQLIRSIFLEFTPLVEPLSLDEAYLDVTHSSHIQGSATLIANTICEKIRNTLRLTASAGISTNMLLAKIASGWRKPNGLFVIRPQDIDHFMKALPVNELFGVGRVTSQKLHALGSKTCADLQNVSLDKLIFHFGEKGGNRLYEQCRGIDNRAVEPNQIRKSLSIEQTFKQDIVLDNHCLTILHELYNNFMTIFKKYDTTRSIKNQCIKIKLSNFKVVTLERSSQHIDFILYEQLLSELIYRAYGKIRLIGIGVHFSE